MTHAIETPEIRNFIQNFAKKNPAYSEAIKGLETLYESTEITGVAVADISANLFGNQEFINSLAMDNSVQAKNIIQKIYEAIKSFLNSFTKEGREKNFVSKLEKMWREAYITQTNNIVAPIYSKNVVNPNNFDYNIKQGDLINDFHSALNNREWKVYHNKINKILNSTYGNFERTDIIGNKLISTIFENGKEQVYDVLEVNGDTSNLVNFIEEVANEYGYSSREIQEFIKEMYGEENVSIYNSTNYQFEPISERRENGFMSSF